MVLLVLTVVTFFMLSPAIRCNLTKSKSNNTLSIRHKVRKKQTFLFNSIIRDISRCGPVKEDGSAIRNVNESLTDGQNKNPLEAFAGHWKMESQENLAEILKALGTIFVIYK